MNIAMDMANTCKHTSMRRWVAPTAHEVGAIEAH